MSETLTAEEADAAMKRFTQTMDALVDTISDAITAFSATIASAHSMSNEQVTIGARLAQLEQQIKTERRRAHALDRMEWGQ